jgi:serine O-acetyltransferase
MVEHILDGGSQPGVWPALKQDIAQYARHSSEFMETQTSKARKIGILLTPGLMCTALHRVSHALWRRGFHSLARCGARINFLLHKAAINPASSIGPGLYLPHTAGVIFSGRAGERLTLFAQTIVTGNAFSLSWQEIDMDSPQLGDGVTIGATAIVLGPVQIGNEARIGPGAVIATSLAARSSVVSTDHVRPHLAPA